MAFKLSEGIKGRDSGIEKTAASNAEWLDRMRKEAVRIARANVFVSTDDLRRYANKTGDQPHSKNAWGSIFRGVPVPGMKWVLMGYKQSAKESNHARRIAVWKLGHDKRGN